MLSYAQMRASCRYYSLQNKFRKITLVLNFRAVFVQFPKNKTPPFFFVQISLLSYLGPKLGDSGHITLFEVNFMK